MSVYNFVGGIRVITLGEGTTSMGLDVPHNAILFTDLPEGSTVEDALDYMNNDSVAIEFQSTEDVDVLIRELEDLKKQMPQKLKEKTYNV